MESKKNFEDVLDDETDEATAVRRVFEQISALISGSSTNVAIEDLGNGVLAMVIDHASTDTIAEELARLYETDRRANVFIETYSAKVH